MAEDVSVTEKFTSVTGPGVINTTTTASGLVRSGDVCNWNFSKLRYSSDVITVGTTNYTAAWLNYVSETEYSELATTNWEGGIKAVSFRWAQFGNGETGNTLKLKVAAGSVVDNPAITRSGSSGKNGANGGSVYEHTFNCKTNGQLVITNVSDKTADGACRILVCNIAITPYLLYRNKDVTIGLKQRGYANDGAQDFINNTGSAGSISYSSSAPGVATVDEDGVITPVSVGTTTITATWSEGASTTYTLHVVDGIIAENFSKVVQTGQTASATWHGDLWDWSVAYVRRGEADTLGLSPRIQATAMRSNAGSTLISKEKIEGGVKHIAFDWRQWGAATTPLTFNVYYSADKDDWGDAVATQAETAVAAATPHAFSEDIDDGTKGNAYLKIEYTSGAGQAVVGAIRITPWLLYTTKAHTIDTRVDALTYTNNDLIDNTSGTDVQYSISPTGSGATIDEESGEVTVTDATEGDFTVTAQWGDVYTTYMLTVVSRTATTASYADATIRVGLGTAISNTLTYTDGYDGTITYSSSNTDVATVASNGTVSLAGGVGQTTITASLQQTENYKAALASYTIDVIDNGARKEAFSGIGVPSDSKWYDLTGDLYTWQRQYQVRHNTDNVKGVSGTSHIGVSVGIQDPTGTPISSTLKTKDVVEGGIKYLSFYMGQIGAHYNATRRIAVYAGEELIGYGEIRQGTQYDECLVGINNAMKSNKQLIIKNESYLGETYATRTSLSTSTNCSRIVLDDIYITPWLLYTDKSEKVMHVGDAAYTREIIDNTAGETGSLTYISSNTSVATVNSSTGAVTAVAEGYTVITAKYKWDETDSVTTSYRVYVAPASNCETFNTASTGNFYATNSNVAEDVTTWSTELGGINGNENILPNAAFFRAKRSNEENVAYIESGLINGGVSELSFYWNIAVVDEPDVVKWDIRVFINDREVKRLTSEAGDALENVTGWQADMTKCTITNINEPGKFVIRFENHTTIDGT